MSKDERCVDHCAVHALSSPTDPSFKANCDHVHNITCDACYGMEAVIEEIGIKIEDGSGAGLDDGTKKKAPAGLSMIKPKRPLVRGRLIKCALSTKI